MGDGGDGGRADGTGTQEARAREALLRGIADQAERAPNAAILLRLAEAYAWVVAPDQPHGGMTEK
jgi:hypothetical protein